VVEGNVVKVARHGKAGGAHKVRRVVIVRPAIIRLAVTMTVAAPEAGLAMKVANRGAPAAAAARLIASARRGRPSLAAASRGAQALAIAAIGRSRRAGHESRATMNSAQLLVVGWSSEAERPNSCRDAVPPDAQRGSCRKAVVVTVHLAPAPGVRHRR